MDTSGNALYDWTVLHETRKPGGRRKSKLARILGTVATVVVFAVAVVVLRHELKNYALADVWRQLRVMPHGKIAAAAAFSLAGYLVLTGYDLLAFRYLRRTISLGRVVFTGFVAFALGNNIGMANFAGAAVRYRLYSGFGVPGEAVAEVVALNVLSNWLGFFLTVGTVFALVAPPLPAQLHLPFSATRPVGLVLLASIVAYFTLSRLKERPVHLFGHAIRIPHNFVFALQTLVGCFDFLFGAALFYFLLPHPLPFSFLAIVGRYLVAQTVGILSHVPGALGVFETILLFSLAPQVPGAEVLGALIAFRAIYFLLPLVFAVPLFAGFEVHQRFGRRTRAA